jgi:hypothetical protein
LRELRDAFTNYTSTLSADHKKQFEVMDDLKYRLQQLQIGQVGGSYGTNVPDIP